MIFPPDFATERARLRERLGASWKYYWDDLDMLLHLKWLGFRPRTIYDIGSSNTVWSVMARLVYPCVRQELFEPLAEISDAYLNGKREHPTVLDFLENGSYRIHPVALGSRNGRCAFRWFENDADSTSLDEDWASGQGRVVDVPMHRLDDFAASHGLASPDLIKLDTQGSELEILGGARRCLNSASVIFIECWLAKGYGAPTPLFLTTARLLSDAGFDLFAIGDEYRSPEGIAFAKDVVFVKRSLKLEPTVPMPVSS